MLGTPLGNDISVSIAIAKKIDSLCRLGDRFHHFFLHDSLLLLWHSFAIPCLSSNEFRCLRCAKSLLNLPHSCDGCSSVFTTSHALDCKKGGLVTLRHNEIMDVLYDVSSLAWSQVIKEPLVKEAQDGSDALIGDISIRGVWQPQSTTILDVRVVDSDAPSYVRKPPLQILKTAEREKKSKYQEACNSIHSSFTPLCMTVDGLLAPETNFFLKHLADRLSTKWD